MSAINRNHCPPSPESASSASERAWLDQLRALADQQIWRSMQISAACCSAFLIGTKRIDDRLTASQIAAVSAASFLPRLT